MQCNVFESMIGPVEKTYCMMESLPSVMSLMALFKKMEYVVFSFKSPSMFNVDVLVLNNYQPEFKYSDQTFCIELLR